MDGSVGRVSGDAHEVDAVSVALCVGKVVAEVSACGAHGLPVGQYAHVFPVDLVVPVANEK